MALASSVHAIILLKYLPKLVPQNSSAQSFKKWESDSEKSLLPNLWKTNALDRLHLPVKKSHRKRMVQ